MAVTAIFRHVVVIAFVEAKNLLRNAIESAIESYVKKNEARIIILVGRAALDKIHLLNRHNSSIKTQSKNKTIFCCCFSSNFDETWWICTLYYTVLTFLVSVFSHKPSSSLLRKYIYWEVRGIPSRSKKWWQYLLQKGSFFLNLKLLWHDKITWMYSILRYSCVAIFGSSHLLKLIVWRSDHMSSI